MPLTLYSKILAVLVTQCVSVWGDVIQSGGWFVVCVCRAAERLLFANKKTAELMSVGEVCFEFVCWCRGQKTARLLLIICHLPFSFVHQPVTDTMKRLKCEWLFWSLAESCGYRNRRRKGIKFLSWKSGAFLGARSAPWLSAHTSDASAALSLLHFAQGLRRQHVSIVAVRWHSSWSDSHIYQLKEEWSRILMSTQTNSDASL